MFKHLNRSTRPETNTNKLDTPTPSSINPYVNLVAGQLYNKANPNEYVVFFRVTYTGTLVDQLLSTQFRNQISLAVYEQLKNKLFAYIIVQPDDDSLQDTKHIFVKTNATSNNELVFTNFSDKGDSTTLSIKKNGSAFLVNVSVSDNSSVISTTLLSKINALSNKVDGVSGSIQDNSEAINLNKTRINQLQQSLNGTDSDVANLEDRLDKLEDDLADGVIELTNYVTKEEFNVVANASQDNAEKLKKVYTIEEVDIEVNDLRQETENYYVKKTDQRIKSVDYNIQTGIFTFTKQDGTIFEVDLAIEKVVTNFIYNKQKNALELTLADGTVQSIPMSDFASAYEGVENDQIQVSIQSGNKIQAILKNGSININHLEPEFANDVGAMVTTVSELLNHVQDNAEAIANRYTKQETSDLIDAEVGDAKEELKNIYLKKSNDPVTDDGQIVIVNADGSTSYTTETFYEIANRISNLEQNQGSGGSGGSGAGAVSSSIFESVTINDFSALEEAQGPYTHFANVTLTNSLDDKASVELLNNNAVLFATYGFAIASVGAGNVVTIYSINKSAEAVTLTFEIVKAYKVFDGTVEVE